MTKLQNAIDYASRVPLPQMEMGAAGTIMANGKVVATMNLQDLTLTEAFAFASAFIAAGEALDLIEHLAPTRATQEGE